jgi:hypothetical protein
MANIPDDRSMNTFFIAGLLAGLTGLLVFLTIHHFWITPIWFILPIGLVLAAAGGLAIGWCYRELAPHLPPRPWTTLAMIGLISAILLPAIILAEISPPLFAMADGEAKLAVSVRHATVTFILELLVTSTLTGGLAGWLISRTGRAALATSLAGFVFALGPGHNIPFIGNMGGTGKGLAILAAIIIPATLVLVESHAFLDSSGSNS